MSKRKVIAIVGPTASGKTGLGVRLAKEFNGEIISADSRQVYRGLDIGTGKDLSKYGDIKYHMIDIANPEEKMTLFDYLPLARMAIDDIFSRGKLPIIVGGTGLYVQGIVEGFELEQISLSNVISTPCEARVEKSSKKDLSTVLEMTNKKYSREQLNNLTIQQLNNLLLQLDSETAERVDKKNIHRLIRAIEMAQDGLKPIKIKPDFEVLQIGVDVPRTELHERIDKRVDERFDQGMMEEVQELLGQGVSAEWLIGLGLEYREITSYLINCHLDPRLGELERSFVSQEISPPSTSRGVEMTRGASGSRNDKKKIITMKQYNNEFELMRQQLKFRIHQFARRQMTWFRRFPEINWLANYDEMKRFVKIFIEH